MTPEIGCRRLHRPWSAMTRTMRRRCRAMVQNLALPRRLTLQELLTVVARSRGRGVILHPLPAAPDLSACYLGRPAEADDVILYRQDTSPYHQALLICHELAHLLCRHVGRTPLTGAERGHVASLAPDAAVIRKALARCAYDGPEELEAEETGRLLAQRLTPGPIPMTLLAGPAAAFDLALGGV